MAGGLSLNFSSEHVHLAPASGLPKSWRALTLLATKPRGSQVTSVEINLLTRENSIFIHQSLSLISHNTRSDFHNGDFIPFPMMILMSFHKFYYTGNLYNWQGWGGEVLQWGESQISWVPDLSGSKNSCDFFPSYVILRMYRCQAWFPSLLLSNRACY